MINKIFIVIALLSIVVISGCDTTYQDSPYSEATVRVEIACNVTPSIFLYPAYDLGSDKPRFFNHTEYEIIRNGDYFGKFEGNRFNKTFLNITRGDLLKIIISAEDEKCFIPKDFIEYEVSCEQNQYITPKLDCANKFKLNVIETDTFYTLKELDNIIRIRYDNVVELKLDFRDIPVFQYFGCSYDKKYVDKTILTKDWNNLFEENGRLGYAFERNFYDMYVLEDTTRYELRTYLDDPELYKDFNTTVYCRFFDDEWFIEDLSVKRYAIDGDWNDLGQENPSFNFTIQFKS